MADYGGRRVIILTPAPPTEEAREFVANRVKFPTSALLTPDLAKAKTWGHYIACQRWGERNAKELKAIGRPLFRRKVAQGVLAAAMAGTSGEAAPATKPPRPAPDPAPAPAAKPSRRLKTTRTTKLDPNKRARRKARLLAGREARRRLGKIKRRKVGRAA